jgi:hypothetical protein
VCVCLTFSRVTGKRRMRCRWTTGGLETRAVGLPTKVPLASSRGHVSPTFILDHLRSQPLSFRHAHDAKRRATRRPFAANLLCHFGHTSRSSRCPKHLPTSHIYDPKEHQTSGLCEKSQARSGPIVHGCLLVLPRSCYMQIKARIAQALTRSQRTWNLFQYFTGFLSLISPSLLFSLLLQIKRSALATRDRACLDVWN